MAKTADVTAVLPPRAVAVAMKTLAVRVMAGAQTTINNHLKAANRNNDRNGKDGRNNKTKAMPVATAVVVAAAEARQQRGGGG